MLSRFIVVGMLAAGSATGASANSAPGADAQVVELRQYKIVPGKRDAFVALFDREFVESQEALGMRLVGQFRDLDDPSRFTWIRSFPDMAAREKGLNAFYFGPVWKAHREEANPMLDDNDNVLLLRPASAGLAFGEAAKRAAPGATAHEGGLVVATVEYLWKRPEEGFTAFFRDEMKPALDAAGLPVLAAYIPEDAPNNFPRLPVRPETKLLVWFTRIDNAQALAAAETRLHHSDRWTKEIEPKLRQFVEREPQQLRLEPTPRSALR